MFGLITTHPAFSRDLNSLLPTFFQTLLNLSSQTALLSTVLTALHTLIPEYPTTFRPTMTKTQTLTLSVIDGAYPVEIKTLAAKVYVDLHHSAQKGGNNDHWRATFLGAVSEIHTVLNRMFQIVEEGIPP
jgi:hypothetical protein